MFFKNSFKQIRKFSSNVNKNEIKSKLGIIGVPFCKGQPKGGVELAPDLLREKGLVKILQDTSRGNTYPNKRK